MNPVNVQLEIHDEVKQQQQLHTQQACPFLCLLKIF